MSGPVTFSAYNMHELLDPVEPYELDRLGALDSPPPRLLLATAGVVILLSRRDGVDSVPRDVGYTAFQRLAKVRPSPFYPVPLPPRSLTLFLPPPALLHGWLVKGGYVYARVRVWVAACAWVRVCECVLLQSARA